MRKVFTFVVLPFLVAFVLFVIFFPVFAKVRYPSAAQQRPQQRETVAKRVQAIGGWGALRTQCDRLLKEHPHEYLYYHKHGDALPASLAALSPQEVQAYPTEPGAGTPPRVLEIKFYGSHNTGGEYIPYYAVWVWGSATPPKYVGALQDYQDFGTEQSRVKLTKLADGVYEAVFPD